MTGSNPMLNWRQAMDTVIQLYSSNPKQIIPITMDFNHRKPLGPLEKLWHLTKEYAPHLQLLVFSIDSLLGISQIENLKTSAADLSSIGEDQENVWTEIMIQILQKFSFPRIACCFKKRNEDGVQKRWSVIVYKQDSKYNVVSTIHIPTYHKPKDECGGGSAWMAGLIHSLFDRWKKVSVENSTFLYEMEKDGGCVKEMDSQYWLQALRTADLSAALCQEVVGDHATTDNTLLTLTIKKFDGKPAWIGVSEGSFQEKSQSPDSVIAETTTKLFQGKVLAIFRSKNATITRSRAKELIEMGCKALEVTLDSTDVYEILMDLIRMIPFSQCCIGVGTVTNTNQLENLIKINKNIPPFQRDQAPINTVRFAISPINFDGFVAFCNENGIVAVPGVFTPNEMWHAHQQGAKILKLFPAQKYSPEEVKDILGVGPLGSMNIMPSGGVDPGNIQKWLDAGCRMVAMGRKLVGNDLSFSEKDLENSEKRAMAEQATKDWESNGKVIAKKVFQFSQE